MIGRNPSRWGNKKLKIENDQLNGLKGGNENSSEKNGELQLSFRQEAKGFQA